MILGQLRIGARQAKNAALADTHWTLQKQLRDMIRIQIAYKTSNMVNGHHHHCGHHHHLSIITGWPLGG